MQIYDFRDFLNNLTGGHLWTLILFGLIWMLIGTTEFMRHTFDGKAPIGILIFFIGILIFIIGLTMVVMG